MKRTALLMVAVGCLVALAGCSGAISDVGDTTTDDATTDDVEYPAGVSENDTNVSALTAAHDRQLENRSFTLEVNSTVNASTGNQTITMTAAVGPDRDQVLVNGSARNQQVSAYMTDEKRYTRLTVGDREPQYRVTERTPDQMQLFSGSFAGTTYLDRFAAEANFTPTDVRTVDGTTLIVLEADGSNATDTERANVTDYEATLLVDEDGVVHSATVDVSAARDGQQIRTRFSMNVSAIGETTVEEPDWLDEAKNETSD
ncbi:hypothetical protein BRC82_01370 [Halobacteriales archaeon QS_1_67_19]|nr:MAG: hypothetical protein BRC82_01370 [Halobacteriales archaeon QS_1_67_19]